MTSRQRVASNTPGREDTRLWTANDSDSDYPRQQVLTSRRHNIEQQASSKSRRRHDVSKRPDVPEPMNSGGHDAVPRKTSSKHRSANAVASSSLLTQSQNYTTLGATPTTVSKSRTTHEGRSEDPNLRTYMKRRVEKHSPRSSNERVASTEEGKVLRPTESRNAYATATPGVQPPATTQMYWVEPAQAMLDPSSSLRHHRERDGHTDRDKEKRREDKERRRARDPESEGTKEKVRDKDRYREKEGERETSSKDKDRRRHKSSERDDRKREDRRLFERKDEPVFQPPAASSLAVQLPQQVREWPVPGVSSRHQEPVIPVEQVVPGPSTSSAERPAAVQLNPSSSRTPRAVPISLRERGQSSSRHHTSHRERTVGHHSGQESGVSSSEQEQPTRERHRTADRRHALREHAADMHPSGQSGSETERGSMRERRRVHRSNAESAVAGQAKVPLANPLESSGRHGTAGMASQQSLASQYDMPGAWIPQAKNPSYVRGSPSHATSAAAPLPVSGSPMHAPMLPTSHNPIPVGLTSQRFVPHIVSIRAGQGPADPQTPIMLPKSPSTATVNRMQEAAAAESAAIYGTTARTQSAPRTTQQTTDYAAYSYGPTPHSTAPQGATASGEVTRHAEALPSASQHRPLNSVLQQPSQAYADPKSGNSTGSFLHPVQQAIRSVEGIIRSSSRVAHRSATVPPAAAPTSRGATASHSVQDRMAPVQPEVADQFHRTAANPTYDPRAQTHRSVFQGASGGSLPHPDTSAQHPGRDTYRSPPPPRGTQLGPASAPVQPSPYDAGTGTMRQKASASNATLTAPRQDIGEPHQPSDKRVVPPPVAVSMQYASSGYPYPNGQSDDPRSPKPPSILPPVTKTVAVAQATFQPPRKSVPASLDASAQGVGAIVDGINASLLSPHSNVPNLGPPSSVPQDARAYAAANVQGYSPSHNAQAFARSPTTTNIAPPTSTPKVYSAARLHSQRNGSSDTITQSPGPKQSPYVNSSQQSLTHRLSLTNLHADNALRPDHAASRPPNVSSGYPELTRYRSPAPNTYPHPQADPSMSAMTPNDTLLSYQNNADGTPLSSQRPHLHPTTSAPSQQYFNTMPRGSQPVTEHIVQPAAYPTASYHSSRPEYAQQSQALPGSGGQRLPPRTAPSPAPGINGRHRHDISSPSSRPTAVPVSHGQPNRNNTFPMASSRRPDPSPAPEPSHSRAASDSHHSTMANRPVANSLHIKSRSDAGHRLAPATEQDLLLTPSSLAPSMLPRQLSSASNATAGAARSSRDKLVKEKESKKRGGIFGFFRSRSSPPKEPEARQGMPATQQRHRKESAPAAPTMQTSHHHVPQTLGASQQAAASAQNANHAPTPHRAMAPTGQPPTPNVNPHLAPNATPASGRKSPGPKIFTPFRLLSRRHRTVSAASVEAVDGTVANTVITGADSTRSSTAGRLSPPLRDPLAAAQEWRNKEEAEMMGRRTARRQRPGVTFDVEDDLRETSRPLRRVPRHQAAKEE